VIDGRESRRVEDDARRIVNDAAGEHGVPAGVAREIALLLEHLEGARVVHAWHLEQLLNDECAIGTELARVEHFCPPCSPAEERLRARLLLLNVERRQLTSTFVEQRATLHRSLLELVGRYRVLEPPDGY
jgi:hypothetical protein